jgi:hypothetical protein
LSKIAVYVIHFATDKNGIFFWEADLMKKAVEEQKRKKPQHSHRLPLRKILFKIFSITPLFTFTQLFQRKQEKDEIYGDRHRRLLPRRIRDVRELRLRLFQCPPKTRKFSDALTEFLLF